MHRLKKIISITLTLILISVLGNVNLNISAAAITTAYIEGENVRVRTGPSLQHQIIEEISYRNATVLDSVPQGEYTWYQITYHNGTQQITGYIRSADYIRIVTYNPDASFEEKLKAFPESYREALRQLKAVYKNWEFIPDPVTITFAEAVELETTGMRKQVSFNSQPVSWRSMGLGSYDWNKSTWITTNGGWTGASREIAAYYMDPRNFLNTTEIYQFLQQGYDANYQTEAGVNGIIAGTFMATNYTDPKDTAYGGSYAKVIMEAAKQSGVSPYILASKIRQEIGTSVTSMISGTTKGYEGYYNFFNIGASGADAAQTLKNGLERAKSEGWNTRSAAIIGGAKFLSNNYISRGQDTYYYQDFNVHQPDQIYHQYAQAIHDAVSKGRLISESYIDNTDFALTFRIPVYTNMPESVSPKPVSNESKNNYYFSGISVTGLTPSFSMYTYEYNLRVSGNTTITVTPVSNATYVGEKTYSVKAGTNKIALKVKAETGYVTDYIINVEASADCTITVNAGASSNTAPPSTTVKAGDTNGDGKITLSDLANVRLHLLGKYTLKDNNALGADTNKDNKISLSDLANIRLHLLGLYTIQ